MLDENSLKVKWPEVTSNKVLWKREEKKMIVKEGSQNKWITS